MQTKTQSLIESVAGVMIGFLVAMGGQYIIYPLLGIAVTFGENLKIAGIFTVISIIRSYLVRRGFNYYHKNKGLK